MKGIGVKRKLARTLLLVGEGDSEVALLRHLKALYVKRGSGLAVSIKTARGKGAAHVVDFAIRQSRNAVFDTRAVLLDTDTDWNDKTQAVARKAKVLVVPADPCLEALLLVMHGHAVEGKTSANLKQVFLTRFGASALEPAVYLKYFLFEFLEKARLRSPELEQLLTLLVRQS